MDEDDESKSIERDEAYTLIERARRYGMKLDAHQRYWVCRQHTCLISYLLIKDEGALVCGGCDSRCLWERHSVVVSRCCDLRFQDMDSSDVVKIEHRYPKYIRDVLETL